MQDGAEIWELLHDGSIVGLDGAVPGDVQVSVEIEYLRAMLPDPGDRFQIVLTGCQLLECHDFTGDKAVRLTDPSAISAGAPEILRARKQGDTVVLSLTRGSGTYMELSLQYAAVTVSVESGRLVPLDECLAAARRYWEGLGSPSRP